MDKAAKEVKEAKEAKKPEVKKEVAEKPEKVILRKKGGQFNPTVLSQNGRGIEY